ncbi:SRPBCC family protein [Actinoplanes aureus]|uniref:SRPBCC family protein n=1 Tax=Actinoplanes aureus TaxID=2792083 RepID=A0A931G378_9ACTN|nr:SRPBCC family protein [Actinoplanes aureus]MBG0566776.1 SRPBCC family protein [Actinoplanes aureus]
MDTEIPHSRHISTHIARPAQVVYDFAAEPTNLPRWAPGLCDSIAQRDGRWVAESPMGRIELTFAERNAFGVLDHDVTLPTGETFHNPMRVTPDGDGSELVFSLRRRPGVSDEDFERDAAAVLADLLALKRIVESA